MLWFICHSARFQNGDQQRKVFFFQKNKKRTKKKSLKYGTIDEFEVNCARDVSKRKNKEKFVSIKIDRQGRSWWCTSSKREVLSYMQSQLRNKDMQYHMLMYCKLVNKSHHILPLLQLGWLFVFLFIRFVIIIFQFLVHNFVYKYPEDMECRERKVFKIMVF